MLLSPQRGSGTFASARRGVKPSVVTSSMPAKMIIGSQKNMGIFFSAFRFIMTTDGKSLLFLNFCDR